MTLNRKEDGNGKTEAAGPVGRRDFLRYAAIAGAVAGAAIPLGNALMTGEATPAAEAAVGVAAKAPPALQLTFSVEIEGMPETSANVVSVQVEDLTIDVRETTTGLDVEYRTYAPGDAHYGKATIRSRIGKNSKELLQWVQDASVGKNIRKNISVIIMGRDGSEARRFNLMECFPVKYDPGDYSPSSTVAVETVTCKMGRVELA